VTLLVIGVTAFDLSPTFGSPIRGDARADAYGVVETLPAGILAEYPAGPAGLNAALEYVLYQREHGRDLLNGARAGSAADDLRLALVDPSAPGTPQALALLGVTGVVTRGDPLAFERGIPEGPAARLGAGYELEGSFRDGYRVWRVTAEAAPAVAVLPTADWTEPVRRVDGFVGSALRGDDGRIELYAREAGTVLVSFDTRSRPASGSVRLRGVGDAQRLAVVDGQVRVPVAVPSGRSQLRIEAAGAEVVISAPRAWRTDETAAIRAELVSADGL
jgi:hypothetical protein